MGDRTRISVVGIINHSPTQQARIAAEVVAQNGAFELVYQGLVEVDWQDHKKTIKSEDWEGLESVVVTVGDRVFKNTRAFREWAKKEHSFQDKRAAALYQALASAQYKEHLEATGHEFVFMTVAIDGEAVGRMVFELYSDVCPKTCANFKALCTGEAGTSARGTKLCYKDSVFHRVQPNGWVQGGDITSGSGDSGESSFEDGQPFADENFIVKHDRRGILAMANKGIHTNASQFFVSLRALPFLNAKFVAFGRLIEGSAVLDQLEGVSTFNQRPTKPCTVTDCGIFKV